MVFDPPFLVLAVVSRSFAGVSMGVPSMSCCVVSLIDLLFACFYGGNVLFIGS